LNTTRISGNIAAVNKFYDVPFNNTIYGNDFPVLRYADVLLMLAEALNEAGYSAGGEALTLLNRVRTRAGATPYTAADLPDQARFREAVYQERRLELPLELHRWYDLVRTGTAPAAIRRLGGNYAANFQDYRQLYPIPNSEIVKINNPAAFPQNPGYQ
ncbi:MAG: RagB/SusD family nutrient uptake outer membrane protein, partial [Cytophagales bacterium]|nr:RagB/SusD family nutrient uptake outer membrane protein [Cytophagales bacterium]